MNDANPRQQIVDSIKNNNNVLVTVSANPSVDALAAALGLTILLNNLGKRGTAVASGEIPPAIAFLDPGKTFEHTTDSLRDFIIALDKEKADHLRYKVDGDVVKIFITPYRTQLGEKDLDFSMGDYNVEMVIALGVKDQENLDKALDTHGAILHDATVATLTAGDQTSTLGGINWQDPSASSLCEMLVSLSEALKEDKPLLDAQIATAFLTGIVSATDRFSNDHTSSRVMTMAAQLMAAGANQQLIAAKLQEAHEIGPDARPAAGGARPQAPDGSMVLAEGGEPAKLNKDRKKSKKPKEEEIATEAEDAQAPATIAVDPQETVEQQLTRELATVAPPVAEQSAVSLGEQLAAAEPVAPAPAVAPEPANDVSEQPAVAPRPSAEPAFIIPPLPPLPEPETPEVAPVSVTPVSGSYLSEAPAAPDPAEDGDTSVDPFAQPLISPTLPPLQPDPLFEAEHAPQPGVGQTITPAHAPDQIDYEESPIMNDPAAVASVPDFAAMNPTGLASAATAESPAEPAAAPSLDDLPPLPPLPSFPELSTPPPLPDLTLPPADTPLAPQPPLPDVPPVPGQFKIPGQ